MTTLPQDEPIVNKVSANAARWRSENSEIFSVETILEWGRTTMWRNTPSKDALTATARLLESLSDLPSDQAAKADGIIFYEDLNEIGARFRDKTGITSANTYVSRSRRLIQEFYRYKADPLNFKPRSSGARKSPAKKNGKTPDPKSDQPAAEPVVLSRVFTGSSIQLGPDKMFSCHIPNDLTTGDVDRIAWWLKSQAVDFDPSCIQIQPRAVPRFKTPPPLAPCPSRGDE